MQSFESFGSFESFESFESLLPAGCLSRPTIALEAYP